jgi:hypothetical protein
MLSAVLALALIGFGQIAVSAAQAPAPADRGALDSTPPSPGSAQKGST